MKLLVINPNISDDVTALIEAEALRSAGPDTTLIVRTAGHGVEYIETRFESLIAAGAVAEIIAEYTGGKHDGGEQHHDGGVGQPVRERVTDHVDGIVVAAFGDPGMPALKELADVPVIGITDAALCAAALQGHRFSIIAISDRIKAWYRDCVERFGLGGRLASIRSINESLNGIGSVQSDFKDTLLALSQQAVNEDGADVVILAGAPLAGLARELEGQIPVPVVDGISAGIRMTEAVVALNSGVHRQGAFAPPPAKRRRGLSENLDAALASVQAKTAGLEPESAAAVDLSVSK
jgi:allantoin racemase